MHDINTHILPYTYIQNTYMRVCKDTWFHSLYSKLVAHTVSLCLSLLWVDICTLHVTIYLLSSCDTIFLFYELLLHKEFMVPMISFLHENIFSMMWVNYCTEGFLKFCFIFFSIEGTPQNKIYMLSVSENFLNLFSKNATI